MVNNKKLKDRTPVFRVIPASNFGIHFKGSRTNTEIETSIRGLHSNRGKYTDLNEQNTQKPLELYYKIEATALGLIQRYKSCYSQDGKIQKHSGRKGLLARRDA